MHTKKNSQKAAEDGPVKLRITVLPKRSEGGKGPLLLEAPSEHARTRWFEALSKARLK